jgi:hypothetical protein
MPTLMPAYLVRYMARKSPLVPPPMTTASNVLSGMGFLLNGFDFDGNY